jgi:uncharacterized protein (DUF488 family)
MATSLYTVGHSTRSSDELIGILRDTEAFAAAIDRLLEWAAHVRVAVMCAEAVPYSCHRRLSSDWA